MTGVVGVVLGAGSSTRLGRPKQLLPFGDRTLLGHVMFDVESATSLDRVVLVTGGAAAETTAALQLDRAEIVLNDRFGTGCASSLLAGLDAAGDVDAIVMLLGDMPGVTAAVIDKVVTGWRERPSWAAVTEYRDQLGHPFLFSVDAFSTLRALHGDKAVWKIIDREPVGRIARVNVDEPLPRDVDDWSDYVEVCAAFGFEPAAPGP